MTPEEIKSLTFFLVDDATMSDADFLVIMQVAANKLFARRRWQFTKGISDSVTTSSKTYTLPSDFFKPLPIWIGDTKTQPIRREQRRLFRESFNSYYLDIPNNNWVLPATPTSGQTIFFDYIKEMAQLALDDTDIATTIAGFHKTFHPLLAYECAFVFFMKDVGSKSDSWFNEHKREYKDLLELMIEHDEDLKSDAQPTAIPHIGTPTHNPDVLDDFDLIR